MEFSGEQIGYPPRQKRSARRSFLYFGFFNALSFWLLTGNIITLFALRLQASGGYIGVLSALGYTSFFSVLVGRQIVPKIGVMRVFRRAWFLRCLLMLLIVPAPVLMARNWRIGALISLGVAVFGFQLFRGIGLVANSPVMGELSKGKDRGAYLARVQLVASSMAIVTNTLTALLLGRDAPIARYMICFLLGIVSGLVSTAVLLRIPEPPSVREGASQKLFTAVRDAIGEPNFMRFIVGLAGFGALSGIVRTFLVVYAKQIYGQPDNAIAFFTVAGSAGTMLMGILSRRIMDRIGAKPIYLFFTLVLLVSLAPTIVAPMFSSAVQVAFFCGIIFLLSTMGVAGGEYCAQVYFFGLIPPAQQLNLGIVYFLTLGLGGSIGVLLGGVAIDLLAGIGTMSPTTQFRIYFGVVALLLSLCLFPIARLERLGARSIRIALASIFSPRFMRSITLLNRLDRSDSIVEERRMIREVAETRTPIVSDTLVTLVQSPSFVIRSEALHGMEHQSMTPEIADVLIAEVRDQEYTTAYVAARIIGLRGIRDGIPTLRSKLHSADYILVAKCMVALARLDDRTSIETIEQLLRATDNPLVITHGAAALRIFGRPSSLPLLFETLRKALSPTNVITEVLLSIGSIFGMGSQFYIRYKQFGSDEGEVFAETRERISEQLARLPDEGQTILNPLARGQTYRDVDMPALRNALWRFGHWRRIDGLDLCVEMLDDQQLSGNSSVRFFMAELLTFLLESVS